MEKKLLVRVAPSAEDLAHVACEIVSAAAAASIGRRRFFRIALANFAGEQLPNGEDCAARPP